MAADPVDTILLHEASPALNTASADSVVVLEDTTGALLVGVGDRVSAEGVRVYCDTLTDQASVAAAAAAADVRGVWRQDLDQALLVGATVVLLRLPKSLAALDEIAEAVARFADPAVRVFAGGRVKHMTRGMNVVLQTHFTTVTASLGQQKSRVLIADRAKPTVQLSYPRQVRHPDVDLTVCAHGGCFAGTSIDLGTRFLASFLNQLDVSASRVVDLGCGTGVLAAMAARTLPRADVLAVDESRAAVLSARATVGANGLAGRVQVTQAHLLSELPDASVDVVLCNPPFHRGAARDSDAALRMFAEAGRTLRPGGELWTVFNAHLPYLPALRRLVGSTKVAGQNRSFFVTRSRARTSS